MAWVRLTSPRGGILEIAGSSLDRVPDAGGVQFSVLSRYGQHLGAAAEELRTAAFPQVQMSRLVTDGQLVAAAQVSHRQRVGGRTGEDEVDLAIGGENVLDGGARLLRMGVEAIGGSVSPVGAAQRLPGFGADARIRVAREPANPAIPYDHGFSVRLVC